MRAFIVTAVTLILFTPLPVQSQTAKSPNPPAQTLQSQTLQSQTLQSQLPQLPTAASSSHSLLQQGLNAQTNGNYRQAEAAYRAAIQINEKDAIAHYNLANVLADQSKVTEAIATYRTAIILDPMSSRPVMLQPKEEFKPKRHQRLLSCFRVARPRPGPAPTILPGRRPVGRPGTRPAVRAC